MKKRYMTIDQVVRTIRSEVEKSGYKLEEHKSASTDSLYFKIVYEGSSLQFRVSDHCCNPDHRVATLRIDHKTTVDRVKQFVKNRCEGLSYRRTKELLGIG